MTELNTSPSSLPSLMTLPTELHAMISDMLTVDDFRNLRRTSRYFLDVCDQCLKSNTSRSLEFEPNASNEDLHRMFTFLSQTGQLPYQLAQSIVSIKLGETQRQELWRLTRNLEVDPSSTLRKTLPKTLPNMQEIVVLPGSDPHASAQDRDDQHDVHIGEVWIRIHSVVAPTVFLTMTVRGLESPVTMRYMYTGQANDVGTEQQTTYSKECSVEFCEISCKCKDAGRVKGQRRFNKVCRNFCNMHRYFAKLSRYLIITLYRSHFACVLPGTSWEEQNCRYHPESHKGFPRRSFTAVVC